MTAGIPETWRSSTASVARRLLRRPARLVRREILPRAIPPAPRMSAPPDLDARDLGVRVVGLLSSASGIGSSGRLCIDSLMDAGHAVAASDVGSLFGSSEGIPYRSCGGAVRAAISIFHLNPPMLLPGVIRSGLRPYYRTFNIGYWAWELESLPREWIAALRFVHAVMVPSRFCQQAVQRHTSKPVLVVPHPVRPVPAHAEPRPRPQDGAFRVLSVFRFGSSFERKNPVALLKAFRAAFGRDAGARLVLKTSDGARHGAEMARLRREAAELPNVEIVDEVWDEQRLSALMRSVDLYAALHRSEGFGLPLAEAIMSGTPVLATNWSGNTDFCLPEHTFPVDYELVPFRDSHPDYEQVTDARWADPSVVHAALQLRRVRSDPAAAHAKAREARRALLRHLETFSYARALADLADRTEAARAADRGPDPRLDRAAVGREA